MNKLKLKNKIKTEKTKVPRINARVNKTKCFKS